MHRGRVRFLSTNRRFRWLVHRSSIPRLQRRYLYGCTCIVGNSIHTGSKRRFRSWPWRHNDHRSFPSKVTMSRANPSKSRANLALHPPKSKVPFFRTLRLMTSFDQDFQDPRQSQKSLHNLVLARSRRSTHGTPGSRSRSSWSSSHFRGSRTRRVKQTYRRKKN